MKQLDIFGTPKKEESENEVAYTSKISAPIYEPKNKKPYLQACLLSATKFYGFQKKNETGII